VNTQPIRSSAAASLTEQRVVIPAMLGALLVIAGVVIGSTIPFLIGA
jgi:hypothetical protein